MRYSIIIATSIFIAGCSATESAKTNNTAQPMRAEKLESTISHTTENQPPKPENNGGKWTQSGDPVDTAKFDAAITTAEKVLKTKPGDTAKKSLAEAYFDRGFALTEARQYASALGDYRRALKYAPNHSEARKWISQIIGIYEMMKKDYPKEGEEPPPLPFTKRNSG